MSILENNDIEIINNFISERNGKNILNRGLCLYKPLDDAIKIIAIHADCDCPDRQDTLFSLFELRDLFFQITTKQGDA